MYCPKCDAPRPNDVRFCRECGTELIPPGASKKGRLWPPILSMALMLVIGISVYLMTRPEISVTPWFTIEDGTLYFDEASYTGSPVLEIPATVDGQTVEKIGADGFRNCDGLTEVILPGTVHTIGENAFQDCDGLLGIKFPESLVSIGEDAFSGCGSLEAIYVPAAVDAVGKDAFLHCPDLEHIFFVGTAADWDTLYPQEITKNTQIYTVSGPDATSYTPSQR